jgi:epoxyqueuosine reductase
VSFEISMATVRAIAAESGLSVAAVTGVEPFTGLKELLDGHIDAGMLSGLDWYDHERALTASDPRSLHPRAESVIAVGIPYYQGPAEKPTDEPRGRIARYAWGVDYHRVFRTRLPAFHRALERAAGRPVEARLLSDTARVVDRAVSARAGLGWYGKHSCLIVPGHGSWVMLAEAIVDIAVERSGPIDHDCGRCSRCLDSCPTGAIVAPYVVETPRCLSFQTIEQRGAIPREIRTLLGDWVFGCDICQEVCPYTGAAAKAGDEEFLPRSIDQAFPRLAWLLRMTEQEFRTTFARSAVLRAKRRGLARNAAVALGNVGDDSARPLLEECLLHHDEPLVRGHAAWAIGRIGGISGRNALDKARKLDFDLTVRREIELALEGQG